MPRRARHICLPPQAPHPEVGEPGVLLLLHLRQNATERHGRRLHHADAVQHRLRSRSHIPALDDVTSPLKHRRHQVRPAYVNGDKKRGDAVHPVESRARSDENGGEEPILGFDDLDGAERGLIYLQSRLHRQLRHRADPVHEPEHELFRWREVFGAHARVEKRHRSLEEHREESSFAAVLRCGGVCQQHHLDPLHPSPHATSVPPTAHPRARVRNST
eukprot:3480142-Rhodomonas_salina.1